MSLPTRKAEYKAPFYLFVDTETTGLNAKINALLEIAACLYDSNGERIHCYTRMVNPYYGTYGREFNLTALKVNKLILKEDSRFDSNAAPTPNDVALEFVKYSIHVSSEFAPILVGQNLPFDIQFIVNFLEEHQFTGWSDLFSYHRYDTASLGLLVNQLGLLKVDKPSLANLAKALGVENNKPHTALSDAETCAQVFFKLLSILRENLHAPNIAHNAHL